MAGVFAGIFWLRQKETNSRLFISLKLFYQWTFIYLLSILHSIYMQNFSDFPDYFTSNLPVLIPITLLLVAMQTL